MTREIEALSRQLDDLSPGRVVAFGQEIETEMARFADMVLDQAFDRDDARLDSQLARMRAAATLPEPGNGTGGAGLIGRLFGGPARDIRRQTDRFLRARQEIDTLALGLEDHIHAVDHGLVLLNRLFEAHAGKAESLTRHVEAARLALTRHRAALAEGERAEDNEPGGLVAQRLQDLRNGIDRLERRIDDLDRSRVVTLGMLATIRQTQTAGLALVEQLRRTVDLAIPAWKTSNLIRLQQTRQRHGFDALADADMGLPTGPADAAPPDLFDALDKLERLEKDVRTARKTGRAALTEAERALRD